MLNLLYGSTALSFRKRDPFSVSDEATFFEVRAAIARVLDPEDGLEFSLGALTKFITSHSSIWSGLVTKLPVMNLTPARRAYVTGLEQTHSAATGTAGPASG